jgi:PKD repeat protein
LKILKAFFWCVNPHELLTVKTTPIKPVASFSATPTSGKAPLKVQFTDKSTGSPTSWKWSFGDSTYSTVKNLAHTGIKAENIL